MMRLGRYGKLKPGAVDEYLRLHREMSPELRAIHTHAGLRNFTIYRRGLDLFSYLECDDWDRALAYLSTDPLAQTWSQHMAALLDDPLPWETLEEAWRLE